MNAPTFSDITIVGVDEAETLKHKDPPPSGLYWVHLKLSALPPPDWATLFAEEHRFPRHSMWREARVSGQYVTVHCPIDEFVPHHQSEVVEDVKNTNLKYREHLERARARKEREQKVQERERVAALKGLGKIKF